MYKRPKTINKVTIMPHVYRGTNSGYKEVLCYVIKGDEHPDPAKLLTWGLWADGSDMPGDYNKMFVRKGVQTTLDIDVTECWTARQERQVQLDGIRRYIKALNGEDNK